jgi:predicted dehydrogenase
MINWGVIGAGNMASKFVEAIKEIKNTKILSVASLTKKKSKELLNFFDIKNEYYFDNYDELINCKEINAVYISSLNNSHKEIIIKAINANKNILCEKPMTLNFDEAENVFQTINKKKIFFLEAFAYRSHPQTEVIKKLLEKQELGLVYKIELSFGYKTRRVNQHSRIYNKQFGGGAILDVGCYTTSYALLLAQIIHPDIDLNQYKLNNISGNICETGVEDTASVDLVFSDKLTINLKTSIRNEMINNCIIYGSKGKIIIPNPWSPETKSYFEVFKNNNSYYKKFTDSKYSIYANQIDSFNKILINDNKLINSTLMTNKESLINMKIITDWKKNLN